jgi:hypothetical protein
MKTTYKSGHDEDNAPAVLALCLHLDCSPDAVSMERHDYYGLPVYSAKGGEYAIGTDEEAQKAAEAYIRDSVWAFNAGFILKQCELPSELEEAIRSFQEKECEGANDALTALIEKCVRANQHGAQKGFPAFAETAIEVDGRGHSLSSYDGEENEEQVNGVTYYIYRTN